MALPVKSDSTQESCHPISSNCVIWQGPDIPFLNLCKGDSISDVTALLASELNTIIEQLKISNYDISCFGDTCPTPKTFDELIQLIINKLCELANITPTTTGAGCPDDCLVTIPDCLGEVIDSFGNRIVSVPLKDFAIFIANKICTILQTLGLTNTEISELDTRVTVLENSSNFLKAATSSNIIIANSCLTGQSETLISEFVKNLETAFCSLQIATGTPSAINVAVGFQCAGLNADSQLDPAAGGATMGVLPGWNLNPANLAQSFSNLWQTVCDLRVAVADLQTQLAACCSLTCDDIAWNFTSVYTAPNIILSITGSIPNVFSYCTGNDATVNIYDAYGNGYSVVSQDIIGNIGGSISIDISGAPALVPTIYYAVNVSMCLTNTAYTCSANKMYSFNNYDFCPILNLVNSGPGDLEVSFVNLVTSNPITYDIRVYNAVTNAFVDIYTFSGPSLGGALANTFNVGPGTYYAQLSVTQNGHVITCGPSGNVPVI